MSIQTPRPAFGKSVASLPLDVERLYDEARRAMSVEAWTAAALVGRKLLMNVAATHGAEDKLTFNQYVDFLMTEGWITPPMRPWVDEIRLIGNEATHELPQITEERAIHLMAVLEMLLMVVFEYPAKAAEANDQ